MGLFPEGDITEMISKLVKQYVSDPKNQQKVLEEVKKHLGDSNSSINPLTIIETIQKIIKK